MLKIYFDRMLAAVIYRLVFGAINDCYSLETSQQSIFNCIPSKTYEVREKVTTIPKLGVIKMMEEIYIDICLAMMHDA